MSTGKVVVVVVLILVVLLSANYVSGLFGSGGDVAESPFDATVTVGNDAPYVSLVVDRVDNYNDASPDGTVDLASGDTITAEIVFQVHDDNGGGTITSATAQYTSPDGSILRPAAALSCTLEACSPACDSATERQYRCGALANPITMQWHDPPSETGPVNNWDVVLTVSDGAGTSTCSLALPGGCGVGVDITTGGAEPDTDLEFLVTELEALRMKPSCPGATSYECNAEWGGITTTDTDQIADGAVIFLNEGNMLLDDLDLTAFDLIGNPTASENIPSEDFSVSRLTGGGACTAGAPPGGTCLECHWDSGEGTVNAIRVPAELAAAVQIGASGAGQATYGLSIPIGPTGTNEGDAAFCLWNQQTGLLAQDYEAIVGDQWIIIV